MANIDEISEMIREAEERRESGNITGALVLLNSAEQRLAEGGFDDRTYNSTLSVALSHTAICFKHLFQNTGDPVNLDKMDHVLYRGVILDIPFNERATFILRFGDLETMRKDYKKAHEYYQRAYDLVEDSYRRGEFLGHLGDSFTDLGQYEKAISCLHEALDLAEKFPAPRNWHQLIIICGQYGRLAKAHMRRGDYLKAFGFVWKYWQIANTLEKKFQMPQRKQQLYNMFKRR